MTTIEREAVIFGVLALGVVLFGKKIAETVSTATVNAAGDVASGAVIGAGNAVGIPATDITQCQRDIAAGHTWEASFSCPAPDFLRYIF